MVRAVALSRRAPGVPGGAAVGAVIVDEHGAEIAHGWSREAGDVHAEEAALAKVRPGDPRLPRASLYSSGEPCSRRGRGRPGQRSCAQLILDAGIRRVVIAEREPGDVHPDRTGADLLARAGVSIVVLGG